MNSPSTNLAWHYPGGSGSHMNRGPAGLSSLPPPDYDATATRINGHLPPHFRAGSSSSQTRPPLVNYPSTTSAASNADADLLLGIGSPYQTDGGLTHQRPGCNPLPFPRHAHSSDSGSSFPVQSAGSMAPPFSNPYFGQTNMQNFGDMMIESQDVDMSMLGLDMMPWFDSYPTHEMIDMFGGAASGGDTHGGASLQSGQQQPPR